MSSGQSIERKNSTSLIDEELEKYLLKRIILNEGWYDAKALKELYLGAYKMGMQCSYNWNDCFINIPNEGDRVIVKISNNNYLVCDFKDKRFYSAASKVLVPVSNGSKWRYLDYDNK